MIKYLRYATFLYFIIYCVCENLNYLDGFYDKKKETYISLVLFIFSLIILYLVEHKTDTLNFEKLKKNFGGETLLEYKIVTDMDESKMKRMFVRGRLDFFWKELDYSFTIPQNCKVIKAKLFAEKISNAKKLSEFMLKKMNEEKNIKKNKEIEYDVKNTSNILFLLTLFSYSIFLLLKYYK